VIDTSALVAILIGEPDAEEFEDAIDGDPTRLMSVASVLETSIALENRHGEAGGRELDLLVHRLPIQVAAVDTEQLEWARMAFRKFGRGRHAASLNFGDCFSYAPAKVTGEPLLYKGGGFGKTDVVPARRSG
jgi:ribonuclease VapC